MRGLGRIQAVVMLIATLAASGALASCGGESTSGGGQGSQVAVYAYVSSPILDWDPAVESADGLVTLNNVYEQLVRYIPSDDTFVPLLATEWSHSDDGLAWTFKIREGVKFHDGTTLDAEAVKFSIDRTIELGQGNSYIWSSVKAIKVVDDYTVQFNLKYPAPIDLIASSNVAAFIVSPTAVKDNPENWLEEGHEAGTGPYTLQSFTMGQEVVLSRFADYWGGWDGKHFDKAVIRQVTESATKRQLIEQGDCDITIDLPSEDIEQLKENPELDVVVNPSFINMWYMMNTQKPPLDNKKVRQALSYAVPYDDIIKYAQGGYGTQSYGAVPRGIWGWTDQLQQYTFDLDKAKSLLAEAGYANGGFDLELHYISGYEAERKAAELYKAELDKLGINLKLRGMPFETMWEAAKSGDPKKNQDIFVMDWWPGFPSPSEFLIPSFHSEDTTTWNVSYYKNPEFDKTLDAADVASGKDRELASQLYQEAQSILVDDAPAVFLYDVEQAFIKRKSFQGFEDNPTYPRVVFFYDCYREE